MANSSVSGSNCSLPSCITTTTFIDYDCKNPMDYLLYEVVGLTSPGFGSSIGGGGMNGRKSTIQEVLDRVLDKGIFIQGECEMCCPDCNNIYVLGSVETSNKVLFGQNPSWNGFELNCSLANTGRSCGNGPAVFDGVVGDCGTISCCNGFQEGFDKMMCLAYVTSNENGMVYGGSRAEILDRILDKGVVEYGTIQGESQLIKLVEWLSKADYWDEVASASYAEVFDRIFDKGIVIWCDPENSGFGIASVETFIKSLSCNQQGENELEYPSEGACCINVKASIETYQKYLIASECEIIPA